MPRKTVYELAATGGIGHNSGMLPSSTIEEVARRHKISRGLLYKLVREGKGPKITKLGTRSIITAADEAAWIEGAP